MKKTAVYFIVLLSAFSLCLTLIPGVHSQTHASEVKVLSYSYYIDSVGYLDVVGEVQNTGTNTLTQVVLTGSVRASDGTDQSDSYAQIGIENMPVTYLAPQQLAPFYMTFFQPNSSPDQTWYSADIATINLNVVQANATTNYQYPDLQVANSQPSIGTNPGTSPQDNTADKGVYWVNGNVKNSGTQAAQNVTVMATFYNSTGNVVGVGYGNTISSLAPSGSAAFKLGAFDLNQTNIISEKKITSYSLIVLAQQPILNGTAPIATPYTNTATPAPTSSGTSAPTSNGSNGPQPGSGSSASTPTWIYGAVVVIVIAVVIAALLTLVNRKKPEPKQVSKSKPTKTRK